MSNLEIAQKAKLQPIGQIASAAGLAEEEFEALGRYRGKLTHEGVRRLVDHPKGRLILVTAVSPTPAGEGKTTVSIGLAQGLRRIGYRATPALREPALGPVFGVKGGACGGGYSQVLPMEEINLFLNGDFPAITAAHGLLSALMDQSFHIGNPLELNVQDVIWPRALDMIDRSLREIVVGLGQGNGPVRSDGFVITPASEVMATLCMSRSIADLKDRLGRMVVATGVKRVPITAKDLGGVGPMAVLLKDAIRPNLVQTIESGPALLHGGPFGNIAHGCSSVLGTQCALGMSDYVVTEGGFGSDLGGEKFLNIVCPELGRHPEAIVLVATARSQKYHGGGNLAQGLANLGQHLDHLHQYGPPVVVAINRFADDSDEELDEIRSFCAARSIEAVTCEPWQCGGSGCEVLAERVAVSAHTPSPFTTIYERDDPLVTKLEKLVRKVYGGDGVVLSKVAQKRLDWLADHGFERLPVCVAKTQSSLSDDASLLGAPQGFDLHVRDLKVSAGAGFVVATCGDIMLMPGMGKRPAALNIDLDEEGRIVGMF